MMKSELLKNKEVWKCPKCNTQLVERDVKLYVDKRLTRQLRWFRRQIKLLKENLKSNWFCKYNDCMNEEEVNNIIEEIDKAFEDV